MGEPRSLWLATAALDAGGRPELVGRETCDVAVLGGGIAGVTAAYLLAREGISVVLLEAREISSGTTGSTTAKVTSLHGLHYDSLTRKHDADTARAYATLNEEALALIDEIREREGIECSWRRRDAYTYTCEQAREREIAAECEAARAAGLRADLVHETSLPYDIRAAVRVRDQAEFQPVDWVRGLAAAAERAGARIFENSRALDVSDGSPAGVRTENGSVLAERVIVATHYPTLDRALFFARLSAQRSYCIAARVEGTLPEGMFISAETPTRSIRTHPVDGGELLIVGGEGHKVGQDDRTPERYDALERWTHEQFGTTEIEYRWSAQDPMPPDQLPYVGRLHPGTDRLLVATGFLKWGMTNGTAAATILRDQVTGRENAAGQIFSSNRLDPIAAGPKLVKENANVAKRFVGDRLRRAADAATLAPGEGAIVRDSGRRVAAYRDEQGVLRELSPNCTHLGCEVRFNAAEASWDCPCHGSRFDARDGSVIEGPAVHGLEPIVFKSNGRSLSNGQAGGKESRVPGDRRSGAGRT